MGQLKYIVSLLFNALPRKVKIVLLIGVLVSYNVILIAYLLFIAGIIPYLIFVK